MVSAGRDRTRLQAGSLGVTPHSRFFYHKAFYSRHPQPQRVSLPIGCSDNMPLHSPPLLCCGRSLRQVGAEELNY